MRKVSLNSASAPDTRVREARLTRHLMGRMLELREDGARILGSQDPFVPRGGVVCVDFAAPGNGEMAALLEREYGVATLRGPQDSVCFSVGPHVSFEDIDYVQGAVYALLLRGH